MAESRSTIAVNVVIPTVRRRFLAAVLDSLVRADPAEGVAAWEASIGQRDL